VHAVHPEGDFLPAFQHVVDPHFGVPDVAAPLDELAVVPGVEPDALDVLSVDFELVRGLHVHLLLGLCKCATHSDPVVGVVVEDAHAGVGTRLGSAGL